MVTIIIFEEMNKHVYTLSPSVGFKIYEDRKLFFTLVVPAFNTLNVDVQLDVLLCKGGTHL